MPGVLLSLRIWRWLSTENIMCSINTQFLNIEKIQKLTPRRNYTYWVCFSSGFPLRNKTGWSCGLVALYLPPRCKGLSSFSRGQGHLLSAIKFRALINVNWKLVISWLLLSRTCVMNLSNLVINTNVQFKCDTFSGLLVLWYQNFSGRVL